MKLIYKRNNMLPGLSWIANVSEGITSVLHGSKVETQAEFFVEGAWGGEFLQGDFDTTEWFCGTGGVIHGDRIVFSTPTGMHAGLFYVQDDKRIIVSNSLCLLMASEGYEFDPKWIGYETYFNFNILQGIFNYDPKVHALKVDMDEKFPNEDIRMVMFRNITIFDDGTMHIEIKPDSKGFENYKEYYTRLIDTMKNMAENAKDEHRIQKYAVTSHISSGYDSAACAAVAKEAGAEKVLTFAAKGKYANDSGKNVADYLGYQMVVEKDAYAYMNRSDFPEVQSISGGDIGNIISFSTFEEDVRGHLVFSGENGDSIWGMDRSFQYINDDIHIVWKNSEIGLSESHLHQEYIPVPMTSYGIRHWTDLFRISTSEEMEPWSLKNDYDRPIPRRILEEKGVPRDAFGMKKYGAGFFYAYDWKKRILSRMSDISAREFEKYVKEHKNRAPINACVRFVWVNRTKFWNSLMSKLHLKLKISISNLKTEKRNSVPNPFAARYLIPWAGEHMINEYRNAIEG